MPTSQKSYIRLKGGYEAKVYIRETGRPIINGTGTWEKGEDKDTYILKLDREEYTLTIEDGTMKMTTKDGVTYIFQAE